MRLFLYRINDRPYGFRVVAILANDQAGAEEKLCDVFGAQVTRPHARMWAEKVGECSATYLAYCDMEFEE